VSKGDIVISVQQKFVERIVAGKKAAELRRRVPRIQPGCRVWIYTKAPEAVISICVTVDRIVTGSPQDIWQSHRSNLGVSLDEFEDYFGNTETRVRHLLQASRRCVPGCRAFRDSLQIQRVPSTTVLQEIGRGQSRVEALSEPPHLQIARALGKLEVNKPKTEI
jgi:predicted transcriptional regulator